MSPALSFVQSVLRQNRVVVFSKTTCPHCKATKALLERYREQYGLRYMVVEADQRNDLEEVNLALTSMCQQSTFPSIFVDSKCLGGNSGVHAKHASGQLQQVLLSAGLLTKSRLEQHKATLLESTRKAVAGNFVAVYGRMSDTYTAQAVAILQSYRSNHAGFSYQFTDLDERADHLQLAMVVREISGQRRLPAVFVGGREIGGNDGLQRLHTSGELAKRIANTKAASTKSSEQSAAEQQVRQLIRRNRVMVFSKTYCPYSQRAKRLLSKYKGQQGLEFEVLEVDKEPDPMEVKATLGRVSGRLTFPNIFVDGQSIGGSDDLQAKHASGELSALLHKAGLIV
ncbi:Thioredoxin reductase 1, cytoplasmic [Coemansia sp. BCRC 34301]|nr:Thioredoxin reductase 1, cytoplasmic [Coemansia sp. BCRC 34301]